jgi:hypothetical protein
MATLRTTWFPLAPSPFGTPANSGLVLTETGDLVARCPHRHQDIRDAQQCADELAHVATLPLELRVEWLGRKNAQDDWRRRRPSKLLDSVSPETEARLDASWHQRAEALVVALAQCVSALATS